MSKKKRFGVSQALSRGFSEAISAVENNEGVFRHSVIPLARIELDPDNPRKLTVDLKDIQQGLSKDDPSYKLKLEEYERLQELALTIKNSGIINPVVVYKNQDKYRVVAGERRCLAAILAGKAEIDARIFNEKPNGFNLKLVQWIENTAREDLSLEERLDNVQDLMDGYKLENALEDINVTLLKELTGLSLSQTSYYLAVLNAPEDVRIAIRTGKIRNLDKAALIAKITNEYTRSLAIIDCANGSSLQALRKYNHQEKHLSNLALKEKYHATRSSKGNLKISLGSTTNSYIVKTIIELISSHDDYQHYQQFFQNVHWDNRHEATLAFRELLQLLEQEHA